MNHQLQHECGRIERLQGSVTQCAKQAKELESLQNMLEDGGLLLGLERIVVGMVVGIVVGICCWDGCWDES